MNGRNDATTFLPLSTEVVPCISQNSKHVNPSGENTSRSPPTKQMMVLK